MTSLSFWKKVVVGVLGGLAVCTASAANWDSCTDDLDRLRRAARDATDKASDVKTKAEEFENCNRYPDIYDLMRDRCRSKASDYQSALSDLESELGTVDSRIRSVRSSCGFDLGLTGSPSYSRPEPPSSGNRTCDIYKGYKGKLPMKTLLETCARTMSEAECGKCLSGN